MLLYRSKTPVGRNPSLEFSFYEKILLTFMVMLATMKLVQRTAEAELEYVKT